MDKPVFVDPTGRRLGALRIGGRVAGGVFAAYLVLVGVSLVAPPGLDKLQVPGVGGVIPAQRAPEVVTTDGDSTDASDAVEDARRSGAAPVTGPVTGGKANGPSTGAGTPTSTPRVTPRPTPVKGKPTAPPGQSTAPGQTANPSPQATPKPKNTPKPKQNPRPSPTPKANNGKGNGRQSAAPVDGAP